MSEAEFRDIVLTLSRKLYSISYRLLRSREDSEDAVQEILLKMWKMRFRLVEYNSVEALATTMIRNFCLDHIRKKKTESLDSPGMAYREQSDDVSPFEIMKETETTMILKGILTSMPVQYSSLIRQRDIEGLEYQKIAETSGQTINNVRVALSRARKMLRDEYNKFTYEADRDERVDRKVL